MSHPAQMFVALYPKLHNDDVMNGAGFRPAALAWDWQAGLPDEWRSMVVAPLGFRRFRDYEAAAQRLLGLDENEQPCYSHYQYRLSEVRSDDDEDFYEETLYAETGISWLLRDGRWLNLRHIGPQGSGRGFFSFSEEMPR